MQYKEGLVLSTKQELIHRVNVQELGLGDIVTAFDIASWSQDLFMEVIDSFIKMDSEYYALRGLTTNKVYKRLYKWEIIKLTPHEIVVVKENPNHFRDLYK